MASAEKLPSGRFRARYIDADGKKRWLPGTYPRKSDARDAAIEEQAKAKRQASVESGRQSAKMTFAQWWEQWFPARDADSDSRRTERKIHDKFLDDRWGDTPLNRIKHGEVQGWVNELARDYSANYTRRIFGVFRAAVTGALDKEILDASPCANVRQPRRAKRAKAFVSAGAEADSLTSNMADEYGDAVNFVLETGLRPGELAGLHVHRLDLERGWMAVADVYVHLSKAIRDQPKDGDMRMLPLSSKAIDIVKRRLEGRDLRQGCGIRHLDGKTCRHPLVFLNTTGGVLNRDVLRRRLKVAADRAEVDNKSPYALRRGYATRLKDAGVDAFEIQTLMGHSDTEVTAEYTQTSPAAQAKVRAALGDAQPLRSVNVDRGPAWTQEVDRGPARGPDFDNQGFPAATREENGNTG